MRLIALGVYLLLVGGCEQSESARHSACDEVFLETGRAPYTAASTSGWRAGAVPLHTTPDRVRALLGEPDSAFVDHMRPRSIGYMSYRSGGRRALVVTFRDSLAFLKGYELAGDSLVTDRGTFRDGALIGDVAEAFPESYACRDYPFPPLGAEEGYSQMFVEDTVRGRVTLTFRSDSLFGVGFYSYWEVDEYRSTASRVEGS